ncbi:MAG: HPP family protein, partial [Comamonas sp.]
MFYVFGINGPMYQGGPERLSHITPVRGVQRPGGLQANAAGVEGQASQARWAAADAPAPRQRDAVSAYASTEQSLQAPRRQLYVVADVMTRGAVTLPIGMRVREAWQLLASHKIAQAPVLDGQQRVVGLLLRA